MKTLLRFSCLFALALVCQMGMAQEDDGQPDTPSLNVKITKTQWATIGYQNGESIGTVTMTGAEAFDHIEAEIRCDEDADEYITFANVNTNGGKLVCFSPEGTRYDLYNGYHYNLIVKGFDVPYYGVQPVCTDTIKFVGEGKEPPRYSYMTVTNVGLQPNDMFLHGYWTNGKTFDVTFSVPVSRVNVWCALGFDGTVGLTASKKSADGTVWTVFLTDDVVNMEGSFCVMIQAWDADGVMARGENGDRAFFFNLCAPDPNHPTAIDKLASQGGKAAIYTLAGMRIEAAAMQKGHVYVVDGKKRLCR